MSRSTETIRWGLLESVERAYYSGPTAGQSWLQELAAFVNDLHRNDRRLIRLAIIGGSDLLDDFIAANTPASGTFRASTWLDGYVGWAAALP